MRAELVNSSPKEKSNQEASHFYLCSTYCCQQYCEREESTIVSVLLTIIVHNMFVCTLLFMDAV